MSSVVPVFRDSGFDAEATLNLGKAYDIACRSLHSKGRAPVFQELLAKKIIESAQRGERDPDRLAAIALGILGPFHRDVTRHFGLVPNFFMSAPDAPEIVEKLWDFAKSAYLENPIPALFKERLFVYLSRFCQVRLLHCSPLRISCRLRAFIGRCRGRAANHRAGDPASQGAIAMAARARYGLSRFDGNQDADRLARP